MTGSLQKNNEAYPAHEIVFEMHGATPPTHRNTAKKQPPGYFLGSSASKSTKPRHTTSILRRYRVSTAALGNRDLFLTSLR